MKRVKIQTIIASVLVFALLSCGVSQAATILTSDSFESSLGNWTADGSASLYSFAGAPDTNLASTGNGAVLLPKAETITLTNPLLLDSQGYTSVTITFNHKWVEGATSRRADVFYADDGVTFGQIANFNQTSSLFSFTLNEGTYTFTDTAKFQIRGFTGAGGTSTEVYVDNIVISGEPTFVPEPSSVALLSLGGLLLFWRRRRHC